MRSPSALWLSLLGGSSLLTSWPPLLLGLLSVSLWVRTLMADWSSMLPSWMRPTRVSWGMSSYWSLLKGKLIIKF